MSPQPERLDGTRRTASFAANRSANVPAMHGIDRIAHTMPNQRKQDSTNADLQRNAPARRINQMRRKPRKRAHPVLGFNRLTSVLP